MFISSLTLNNFRNYDNVTLHFNKQGACFIGENGAGKTNILEAIYFLSFGRSHRGASKKEMIHSSARDAYVEGIFEDEDGLALSKLSIGFSRDKKIIVKRDNKNITFLSDWFSYCNIVSLGPQDILLVYGDPSERRKYTDILLSQSDAHYLENLIYYRKSLLNRNKLLTQRVHDKSIEIYEEYIARCGAYIIQKRTMLFEKLSRFFSDYYNQISVHKDSGTIHYKPNVMCINKDSKQCEKYLLSELRKKRERDYMIGFTSSGPHRDDFLCLLHDKPIKQFGSQGQCRSAALALRLCSVKYLEEVNADKIILLVDDAFAELDSKRTEKLFSLISNRGQLFFTSTQKQTCLSKIPHFCIERGVIRSHHE